MASRVRWTAELGVLYQVLVFGRSVNQQQGDFGIRLREVDPEFNDVCRRAESLVLNKGFRLSGQTFGAALDVNFRCGEFGRGGVQNLSPAVWYTVTGMSFGDRCERQRLCLMFHTNAIHGLLGQEMVKCTRWTLAPLPHPTGRLFRSFRVFVMR